MQLLSVNLGQPEALAVGPETRTTGIFKRPVAGPVHLGALGVRGDCVADTADHGGKDQAVYLYSAEDYAWWSGELSRELPPGSFGENLTLTSFGPGPARVGDRLRVGTVLLELTAPRIPCATLAARMGDRQFVKRFAQAGRPGAYARVLEPGEVRAGDPVSLSAAPEGHPTLAELFTLWYAEARDPAELRRALCAPLAERARHAFERWLAQTAPETESPSRMEP